MMNKQKQNYWDVCDVSDVAVVGLVSLPDSWDDLSPEFLELPSSLDLLGSRLMF